MAGWLSEVCLSLLGDLAAKVKLPQLSPAGVQGSSPWKHCATSVLVLCCGPVAICWQSKRQGEQSSPIFSFALQVLLWGYCSLLKLDEPVDCQTEWEAQMFSEKVVEGLLVGLRDPVVSMCFGEKSTTCFAK